MSNPANYRTMAEYFIRGIADGTVTAAQVIAWTDEVIVVAPKTENWMLDISSSSPDDHTGVLHHLHAVQGDLQADVLADLLAKK